MERRSTGFISPFSREDHGQAPAWFPWVAWESPSGWVGWAQWAVSGRLQGISSFPKGLGAAKSVVMEKIRGKKPMKVPNLVPPDGGDSFDFGGLGVHWKLDGIHTDRRFSIVHHPIAPHALAAPLHRHQNEDEYSYVAEGTLGALLGDDTLTAGPGSWVVKPRHQWHTFWNPGDAPCLIIEVISPAGFENYFREVAAAWGDLEQFARINAKYSLSMDFESIPRLCRRFGLTFPKLEPKAEYGVMR